MRAEPESQPRSTTWPLHRFAGTRRRDACVRLAFVCGPDAPARPESLPAATPKVYRQDVSVARRARRGGSLALLLALLVSPCVDACTTIDPGSNFVVPDEVFDANYYYCHVEPQLIIMYKCGPGDPAFDQPNSCHFSSAVSGMELLDHPAIDCGGGDTPLDPTQVGTGSPAETDLESVSLEMSRDYTSAPLYNRPSSTSGHPRAVISRSDPAIILLLSTWAAK
jgi:hypothetical protein